MISFAANSLSSVIVSQTVHTDQMFLIFFNLLTFSYFVGAFPTAYLLVKRLKGIDIRTYGSGNSGATNASRLLGKSFFFLILLIDACKAFGIVALSHLLLPELNDIGLLMCAGMVLLGNAFSIFIGFRGGKAVATSVGLLFYFLPVWLVGVYLIAFVAMFMIARRVDVAALTAVMVGALFVVKAGVVSAAVAHGAWILAVWVWIRHWQNVLYLLGLYTPKF